MSSHSQVLVADAFVAGSLQQAIFANDEGYGIIDGPEAEPRAARANDIHLFRHAAFEIRPANPEGFPISIDVLKRVLREETAFFQGLDGLLVGMDPEMSKKTRLRAIARADRILDSDPSVAFRIRNRFLTPISGQEWDQQSALVFAVEQGPTQAEACYRPLADRVVDQIVDDIAVVVSEQYGTGAEATENRDSVLRCGLVADLVRIEVECDRNAATNLAFQARHYPALGTLIRSRHMLMALGQLVLRRLASPSPIRSVEGSGVADVIEQIDPIIAAAESVADGNSGSGRGGMPSKAFDLTAIQRQIAWIGDQLSSGEVGRAEEAIVDLVRLQAECSRRRDVVKTLTSVADLARGKGYVELTWRLLSAIDFVGHADAAAQCVRASLLSDEGRLDEALGALDQTIERFPDDVVAHTARAETLRAMGRLDEALDALDQTIERFPDNVVARTARAETLRAMGRLDEALDALDQTIERFPDNVVTRTARAETLRAMGRLDEALDALDQTIERFPDNVVTRTARAETLRAMGRPDEALDALDQTIERFPDNVVARNARAETLRAMGRLDEALGALDQTIERFPDDVVARTARAETLRAMERPDEALDALDQTIERFPDDVVARTARAETLRAMGRPDEALDALDQTIERFPDNVVARNARAETLRAMGRLDEALGALDQTIERFPDDVVARTARAETLRAMERPDEALDALDQTIERFPDDVVARTARAETLRAMGRPDEALDALDQTIERFPDNVVTRNTYAHHLALRGKFDRAMAILKSAAAQPKTRDDWVAKHILAMAWLRTGHFDEAYASLDEGARQCPFVEAQIYFRTARPIARLAARQAREAIEEFDALVIDTTLSETQATNVVLLRAHAFAEIGEREYASRLIHETTTVIDFEAARQKLAGALRQRYGLGEGEAASGELADRLDEEITGLEIDLESPLRLAA